MIQRKLKSWIKQRLEMVPAAHRFELQHAPEMSEEVTTLVRQDAGSGDSEERARDLAEACYEQADDHSKAYEGRQRYKLFALDENSDEVGVYVFALGFASSLARAEPGEPTERGLLAQLMRHNQLLAQINVEQSQAVNSALMSENRDLRQRVEHVESQRQEWFELLEDLHAQRHARELELTQAGMQSETRARALKLLTQYAPEVIKKLGASPEPKILEAPKSKLELAHEKMRRVWRTVDRDWLLGKLKSKETRKLIDSLLGIGEPIATYEEFVGRLKTLWAAIPDDVSDELQSQILNRDASLALELVELLESGKAQKDAAE